MRYLALACAATALAAAPGAYMAWDKNIESSPRIAESSNCGPGEILIDFEDTLGFEAAQILTDKYQVDLVAASSSTASKYGLFKAEVDDVCQATKDLSPYSEIESLGINHEIKLFGEPNDPLYDQQWNMAHIQMPDVWGTQADGGTVVVAVLDTGVKPMSDLRLASEGGPVLPGTSFIDEEPGWEDEHGHGTHVSGTIAQETNNKHGAAGIAPNSQILPVKVLSQYGSGTMDGIVEGIYWAAENGAHVINMSLGGPFPTPVLCQAIEKVRKQGVVVVAAAGNETGPPVGYPAACPAALAVSAYGPDGMVAPYSSYGPEVFISAPGGNKSLGEAGGILQQTLGGFESYQGTSMATPHVAGVAAVLMSAGCDADCVESSFEFSSVVPDWKSRDMYGHGMLNAALAVDTLGTVKRGFPMLMIFSVLFFSIPFLLQKNYGEFVPLVLSASLLSGMVAWVPVVGCLAPSLVIYDWPSYILGDGLINHYLFKGSYFWHSALTPFFLSGVLLKLAGRNVELVRSFVMAFWLVSGVHFASLAFMSHGQFFGPSFLATAWLLANSALSMFAYFKLAELLERSTP